MTLPLNSPLIFFHHHFALRDFIKFIFSHLFFIFFSIYYIFNVKSYFSFFHFIIFSMPAVIFVTFNDSFWFSGVLFHSHLFLLCGYKTLDLSEDSSQIFKNSLHSQGLFPLGFMLVFPCGMLVCCLLILGCPFVFMHEILS